MWYIRFDTRLPVSRCTSLKKKKSQWAKGTNWPLSKICWMEDAENTNNRRIQKTKQTNKKQRNWTSGMMASLRTALHLERKTGISKANHIFLFVEKNKVCFQ